jgi:epoxyqueuosine reductase
VSAADVKDRLRRHARELGFTDARFVSLDQSFDAAANGLDYFLKAGWHGDMDWMATHAERRRHPKSLWPDAKSAIVLAFSYTPDHDPLANLANKTCGNISVYARGKDYHDVIKPKLKQVASRLADEQNCDVKVFVDTAPLMEKPLAQKAGLGWQGKHTNLVSRDGGSWLFLAAILTSFDVEPDAPETDHCGDCTRCLTVCPTNAFPKPYLLDARRCISYLTIEHKGHIPLEFRKPIGNRIYGCDDCLAVCPWNKFAVTAGDQRLQARDETTDVDLAALLKLDDAAFRKRFAGTPVKRTGRSRMRRNALIAAGNSKDSSLEPVIVTLLEDNSPLVRAMAIWALAELGGSEALQPYQAQAMKQETDRNVLAEWRQALAEPGMKEGS